MSNTGISVVICVKNTERTIERLLSSINRNYVSEIIVVDGLSQDNTLEISRKYADKIISDQGRGLGYARQLGAENASGDYIAYLDSDTELPTPDLLPLMVKELEENNWVAVHAKLVDPRNKKTYWETGEDFHWRNVFDKAGEREALGTIVCIIRRDIILKYGFDKFFRGAAEDGDFYYRLRKDGLKIGVSKFVAYHYHRGSIREFIKQRVWYGKGNYRFFKKHKELLPLLSPLVIPIYGFLLCVRKKKLSLIPFYITWGIGLGFGTLLGFIDELINKL